MAPPIANRNLLESPLELLFIENLEKFLSPDTEILPQYEVQTLAGNFRLDFVIQHNSKKIGFECDGKDFHDEWRDEWRDGLILQTKEIDTIYRFRGKDLFTFINDCIYIIYHYDKALFNDRFSQVFPSLVSPTIYDQYINSGFNRGELNTILYDVLTEDGTLINRLQVRIERRSRSKPGHWKLLADYAISNPGHDLDSLMKIRANER